MKDRKQRVRYKSKKISNRNRLSVFRSNNHLYAQLIDDKKGVTLASSSSIEKSVRSQLDRLNKDRTAKGEGYENAVKRMIAYHYSQFVAVAVHNHPERGLKKQAFGNSDYELIDDSLTQAGLGLGDRIAYAIDLKRYLK